MLDKYVNSAWVPIVSFTVFFILDSVITHRALDFSTNPSTNFFLNLSLLLELIKTISFIGIFVAIVVQIFRKRWVSLIITLLLLGCLSLLGVFLIGLDLSSVGI